MKKWNIVAMLACAQFVMVLDSTVMNVSISEVVADLGTTISGLQAAITFYTLTMASLMLTGGKLGDRWGRLAAFRIGSVIYGIGSIITAFSPNLLTLMIGWSLIEGLGAVLAIPAIAALIATHYSGKDRIVGYTVIGAISGVAVALGPLIGGYVSTYLSWRYVFMAETVIMLILLVLSRSLTEQSKRAAASRLDIPSVLLSAAGMGLFVYGILQSKTWGWVIPKTAPEIGDQTLTPLGISVVAYLITAGALLLYWFVRRQRRLEATGQTPLLRVSLLQNKVLRGGLGVLSAQYLTVAGMTFMLPIYLQLMLGFDALATGTHILPLSVTIVIFSMAGSRLVGRYSPKAIVRVGQSALVGGALVLLGAINPELKGFLFTSGLLLVGTGLGLLASQIGNIIMSSAPARFTSELGGLQGTFQNVGATLGTAIIGSVLIGSLTTGFINTVSRSDLPAEVKSAVEDRQKEGIPVVAASEIEATARSQGVSQADAAELESDYNQAQLHSLRAALFVVALLGVCSIILSRHLPNSKVT